jgi:cell division septation protein DedD
MKNGKIVISSIVVALLATGCVKPTDEPNNTASENVVYEDEATSNVAYEESVPTSYTEEIVTTTNTGVNYGGEGTIITTEEYQPAVTGTEINSGAYSDPYNNGGVVTSETYSDPYGSNGGGTYTQPTNTYTQPANTYTNEVSYSGGGATSGGIHLQVAALRDYYAAEEFKNGLSLEPKYSAYVKRGDMNKVIVQGFSSRSEAKRLAARQFPGAFIVAGSSGYTAPPASNSNHNNYNDPYGGSAATYTPPVSSVGSTNSGIGVQVGAFSSQVTARNAAESAAAGRYTAVVKTVTVRGRTLYKAIILGFSSRQQAKAAIASGQFGNGFVVSNIYP